MSKGKRPALGPPSANLRSGSLGSLGWLQVPVSALVPPADTTEWGGTSLAAAPPCTALGARPGCCAGSTASKSLLPDPRSLPGSNGAKLLYCVGEANSKFRGDQAWRKFFSSPSVTRGMRRSGSVVAPCASPRTPQLRGLRSCTYKCSHCVTAAWRGRPLAVYVGIPSSVDGDFFLALPNRSVLFLFLTKI